MVTYQQLRDLDFSDEAIEHLVRTDRLWRVFVGVYALEGPLSAKGRAHAAVLRMGERSKTTCLSAAVLADLWATWPARPQILLAGKGGTKGPSGIELHHSTTLKRADVIYIDGIRTTSPRRTILDCSKTLNAKASRPSSSRPSITIGST